VVAPATARQSGRSHTANVEAAAGFPGAQGPCGQRRGRAAQRGAASRNRDQHRLVRHRRPRLDRPGLLHVEHYEEHIRRLSTENNRLSRKLALPDNLSDLEQRRRIGAAGGPS